jgi:hypothetical protein
VFSVLRGLLGLTVDGAQVPIGKTEKIKKVWCAGLDQTRAETRNRLLFLSLMRKLHVLSATRCWHRSYRTIHFLRLFSVCSCLKITHCDTYSGRILCSNAKFSISHQFFRWKFHRVLI